MTTVLCHGVFDMLHYGHVEHLREARGFGDRLVVSLVPDIYLSRKKYPILCSEDIRRNMLLALKCVDEVFLCNAPGPELVLRSLRPNIYARGSDYMGKYMPESKILEEFEIQVRYTAASIFPRRSEIIGTIIAGFK